MSCVAYEDKKVAKSKRYLVFLFIAVTYIIGQNYHGHYFHAGGLSVNNYVGENKVREVNVRE